MKSEYLQNIPEGWEVKKLKFISTINEKSLEETTDDNYMFFYCDISNVSETGFIGDPVKIKFKDAPSRARRIVKEGDTIISTVRTYLKAISFIENISSDLIVSTGFATLSPNDEIFSKFLYYFVSSEYFVNEVVNNSTGTIYPAINSKELGNLLVCFPNKIIQIQICEFLDIKFNSIKKIELQHQKLFEIFQEHTETLLFTGGVDENAKKKKSDIFWLPEIPKNWKTEKAKHLFGEISIKNFPNETILSATQDKGVIPRSDIEDGVVMPAGDRSNYKLVEIGEFVISLRSFQGGIEYSGYRGLVSPAYTVLRAKQEIGTSFYKYLFKTSYFIGALNTIITGIRDGKNINYSDFAELILPVPPLEEQIRIGEILDNKQQLIAHYQKEISLLQEYRTRLISDAVFGKFIN